VRQASVPPPEPRPTAPQAGSDPPPPGSATEEQPTPSPGLAATLKPREIVLLTAAGIPVGRWNSLPSAVTDLVRAHATAVRNGRILVWTAWICAVLDLGAINLVGTRDPDAAGAFWIVVLQLVGGFLALVPGPWRTNQPPPKLPIEFAALADHTKVVRFRSPVLDTYERGRLRHGGWVLLVAGLITLFVLGVIVLGRQSQ
jgi:hypothetical protein